MSEQNTDGIIVILSYPDTIVRPAYWEPSSKIFPLIGIGGKHAVQAGHAALLLIKKESSEINYFDFGRYITTYGNGRVRCKETDPDVHIPIKPIFEKGTLINLKEILLWIEKHPKKTHGDGRLVSSMHDEIDFKKAHNYIHQLVDQKEIPYGAFIKNGTNCARFVTDTIIASSTNKKIEQRLKKSNLLTPSPIGNVINANTNNIIYNTHKQQLTEYKNRSITKEYKASFFKTFKGEPNLIGTELPNNTIFKVNNGNWLGGIGSGAWFNIEEQINSTTYKIARYTSEGIKDFEDLFSISNTTFNPLSAYRFIHPTSCKYVLIKQKEITFCFKRNH